MRHWLLLALLLAACRNHPNKPSFDGAPGVGELSSKETKTLLGRLPSFPQEETSILPGLLSSPGGALAVPAAKILSLSAGEPSAIPEKKEELAPLRVLRYSPEGDVWQRSISILFSKPMVSLGAEDALFQPAKLTPSVPGVWRWEGTQQLVFEPASTFLLATTFTVSVPKETKALDQSTLDEPLSFTFSTSPPALSGHWPDQYSDSPLQPVLLLRFNQPIATEEALDKIVVSAGKKIYPTRLATPKERAEAKHLSSYWKESSPEEMALWLEEPLPVDQEITVTIRPGVQSLEGPNLSTKESTFTFRTYKPLTITGVACGYEKKLCEPYDQVSLNLSDSIDDIDASWIALSPAVKALKIESGYESIRLSGEFAENTKYTVTLSPKIVGRFGQPLITTSTSFNIGPSQPSLSFPGEDLFVVDTVEEVYLPISVYQADSASVKVYEVKPRDFSAYLAYRKNIAENKKATPPGTQRLSKTLSNKDGIGVEVDLSKVFPSGTGHVVIEATTSGLKAKQQAVTARAWIQFTKLSITARYDDESLYAQVTSLETGAPIKGAIVTLQGSTSAIQTTDSDGNVSFPLSVEGGSLLLAQHGDDTAFLFSDLNWVSKLAPIEEYPEMTDEDRKLLESARELELWKRVEVEDGLSWWMASDRGLYRAGEEVKVKGLLRQLNFKKNGDVELPGVKTIRCALKDDRSGAKIVDEEVSLSALGGFVVSFKIPKSTSPGHLHLSCSAKDGKQNGTASIEVREFRRPEFEVKMNPPQGPLIAGESMLASIDATYYSGGAISGSDAAWAVDYYPKRYTPPNHRQFTFGREPSWRSSGEWPSFFRDTTRSKGKTDQRGRGELSLTMPSTSEPFSYVAEIKGVVSDLNGQYRGGEFDVMVHPASLYVGLRPERYYYTPKDPISVDAIVVGIDGTPVSEKDISIEVERYRYEKLKDAWVRVSLDTQSCQIRSGEKATRCNIENRGEGYYEITATIYDDLKRKNQAQTSVSCIGKEFASYHQRSEVSPLDLFLDKTSYTPGDKARLTLVTPHYPADVLLTIVRGGILSTKRVEITAETTSIDLDIDEGLIPNAAIQVQLTEKIDFEKSRVLPETFSRYIELDVSKEYRRLSVEVSPEKKQVRPKEKTSIELTVRDSAGKVVPNAEVTLVVVDDAILSIANNYRLPEVLSGFYPERSTSTGSQNSRYVSHLIQRGYGSGRFGSRSASSPSVVEGKANIMGGPPPVNMREDFRPLAVFEGFLQTDASGKARATFTMPDNLTRYRVMVVAADVKRFGYGESEITASLPLMVRPSLPRFLRVGDQFSASILLQNQTEAELVVKIAARAKGIQLTQLLGYEVKIPAHQRAEVSFGGVAQDIKAAHFQLIAESPVSSDAVQLSLPVYPSVSVSNFAVYGSLSNSAISQALSLPKSALSSVGGLRLTASTTALSEVSDAALYLSEYEYECSEQLASRVMSFSVLQEMLDALHPGLLPSKDKIAASMKKDIERLIERQSADGSFGLWRQGDVKWPYLNTYVTLALLQAKQHGYAVSDEVFAKASSMQKIEIVGEMTKEASSLEAYRIFLTRELGEDPSTEAKKLWTTQGNKLSSDALSIVLLVLADAPEAKEIQRELTRRMTETKERVYLNETYDDDEYLLLPSARRTNAMALLALMRADAKSDLVQKLLSGILASRQSGHWVSTQENAWVLLALSRYFTQYEKVSSELSLKVWLGDSYEGEAKLTASTKSAGELLYPMNKIADGAKVTLSSEGEGLLYYRLGVEYAQPFTALKAANQGFRVERSYEAVDEPGDVRREADGTWKIKSGAKVRVHLSMTTYAARYHVALIDPMPAGFEALDKGRFQSKEVQVGRARYSYDYWYLYGAFRDERAEFFDRYVTPGTSESSYVVVATTPGRFVTPPTKAEEMYSPDTFGRSEPAIVVIE